MFYQKRMIFFILTLLASIHILYVFSLESLKIFQYYFIILGMIFIVYYFIIFLRTTKQALE